MKIVFLSFYSGLWHRGMETVVDELATRLAKNHEILVIQTKSRNTPQKNYQIKRIQVSIDLSTINDQGLSRKVFLDHYSWQVGKFTLKSLEIVRKFKPEIVIPANGGWQSLIMKGYCWQSKAKLVLMGQAGLGWDDRWNLLLKPDLFVALSKRNASWARKYSWRGQKIITIPNGVDLNKFKIQTTKGKAGIRDSKVKKRLLKLEKPVILCIAGREHFKRVRETIDAVAGLPKGSLLLACESSAYDELGREKLGKRFLREKFTHQEMPAVFQKADLFTLVSESSEAFGVAYLEAMACGLPVVATDDELRKEIVGKAGLFIKNPNNTQEYVKIIKQALKHKWGSLPRKQAEKFSWEKIALAYEKAFNDLYEKNN